MFADLGEKPGLNRSVRPLALCIVIGEDDARQTESLQTLRWREMDSNPRFTGEGELTRRAVHGLGPSSR